MTNDELIHWAHLEDKPELRAELDALIWITQNQARMEVWRQLESTARMRSEMETCSSYPGGLLKRRKNDQKK